MGVNPFDVAYSLAANYAAARPYYHPAALTFAAQVLGGVNVDVGVDIGCGTGLSTRALVAHAGRIVGVDPSLAMLSAADAAPGVCYVAGVAEQLPVADAAADLITCGAAMHWFADAAYAELARILRPDGHLIAYSDFFLGEVEGEPGFTSWMLHTYLPRLPVPPRREHYPDAALRQHGIFLIRQKEHPFAVPVDATGLAAYLMTQSNATLAVTRGDTSFDALRDWIEGQLQGIITGTASAKFALRVWLAHKPTRSEHLDE